MNLKFLLIANPFFLLKIKYLKINMLKNGSKKGFLLAKIDFAFLPTAFIVYGILVHYRVGSLEKNGKNRKTNKRVHYRVGSLESNTRFAPRWADVHYRVGRLKY